MRDAQRIGFPSLQYLALPLIALIVAFALQQTTPAHALFIFLLAMVFIVAFISTPMALYLLIFSMLLSPEFMVGQIEGKGMAGRGLTLRMDDFLLFAIGLSWLVKSALNKELGLLLRTPLNRPIFYYILACVLATSVGIIAGRVQPLSGALFTLKYFEYFFIYFMVVNHVRSKDEAKRYLIAALVTAAIVSVYGILQIPGGGRVSAPFEGGVGEPNTLGGYLVLMFCVAMGLCLYLKERRLRMLLGALGFIMLITLSATLSRSSYIALGVSLLVLLALSPKRMGLLIGLSLMIALSPIILPDRVIERVTSTINTDQRRDQVRIGQVAFDTSTSYRLISWKTSTQDWLKHPVFGYGVTGYGFIDAQYFKVLVDTGLVGILAFLALLYRLWGRMIEAYRQMAEPWTQGLVLGVVAGYAGLLVHAIGANTFIIVRIMEPFWLLVGLIMVVMRLQSQADSPSAVQQTPLPHNVQPST